MASDVRAVAAPIAGVPMLEAKAVRQMRELAATGWSSTRIAAELGVARNSVPARRRGRRGTGASRSESARRRRSCGGRGVVRQRSRG